MCLPGKGFCGSTESTHRPTAEKLWPNKKDKMWEINPINVIAQSTKFSLSVVIVIIIIQILTFKIVYLCVGL